MSRDSLNQLLQPGDLIEFKNINDLYAHWGVYVGNDHVVHVIGNVDGSRNTSLPNSVAEGLAAFVGAVDTYVRKGKIKDVAKNRTYFKNNQLDSAYQPLPRNDIVDKANNLVGIKWDYRLLSQNCEHFASMMRYGVSVSLQALPAQNLVHELNNYTRQVAAGITTSITNYVASYIDPVNQLSDDDLD